MPKKQRRFSRSAIWDVLRQLGFEPIEEIESGTLFQRPHGSPWNKGKGNTRAGRGRRVVLPPELILSKAAAEKVAKDAGVSLLQMRFWGMGLLSREKS